MDWVTSTVKPEKLEYQKLPNGKAFVMLRKDIQKVTTTFHGADGEEFQDVYMYHEKQFITELSKDEVESRFDELYLTSDVPEPDMKEVVNNLSDIVDDLMTRVDELEGN